MERCRLSSGRSARQLFLPFLFLLSGAAVVAAEEATERLILEVVLTGEDVWPFSDSKQEKLLDGLAATLRSTARSNMEISALTKTTSGSVLSGRRLMASAPASMHIVVHIWVTQQLKSGQADELSRAIQTGALKEALAASGLIFDGISARMLSKEPAFTSQPLPWWLAGIIGAASAAIVSMLVLVACPILLARCCKKRGKAPARTAAAAVPAIRATQASASVSASTWASASAPISTSANAASAETPTLPAPPGRTAHPPPRLLIGSQSLPANASGAASPASSPREAPGGGGSAQGSLRSPRKLSSKKQLPVELLKGRGFSFKGAQPSDKPPFQSSPAQVSLTATAASGALEAEAANAVGKQTAVSLPGAAGNEQRKIAASQAERSPGQEISGTATAAWMLALLAWMWGWGQQAAAAQTAQTQTPGPDSEPPSSQPQSDDSTRSAAPRFPPLGSIPAPWGASESNALPAETPATVGAVSGTLAGAARSDSMASSSDEFRSPMGSSDLGALYPSELGAAGGAASGEGEINWNQNLLGPESPFFGGTMARTAARTSRPVRSIMSSLKNLSGRGGSEAESDPEGSAIPSLEVSPRAEPQPVREVIQKLESRFSFGDDEGQGGEEGLREEEGEILDEAPGLQWRENVLLGERSGISGDTLGRTAFRSPGIRPVQNLGAAGAPSQTVLGAHQRAEGPAAEPMGGAVAGSGGIEQLRTTAQDLAQSRRPTIHPSRLAPVAFLRPESSLESSLRQIAESPAMHRWQAQKEQSGRLQLPDPVPKRPDQKYTLASAPGTPVGSGSFDDIVPKRAAPKGRKSRQAVTVVSDNPMWDANSQNPLFGAGMLTPAASGLPSGAQTLPRRSGTSLRQQLAAESFTGSQEGTGDVEELDEKEVPSRTD